MMDNRTAHFAGSSHQPSGSILKPSRSSHGRQRARSPPPSSTSPPSPSRRTVQIVDAPETQITRSLAAMPTHGPIPEMTITFPAVRDAEQLEQLAFEFARQVQARRRQLESNLTRPLRSAGRPTRAPDEYPEFRDILMGPWQAGANYGPVLRPREAMKLGPLRINPHICSTGEGPLVRWDVTQPVASAVIIQHDGHVVPFDDFRYEPATSPRITQVKTISRLMHWDWRISSDVGEIGVTIGDLLRALSVVLPIRMNEWDMKRLDEEAKNTAIRTYQARCPEEGKGPRIYDILSGHTLFGGWVHDQDYERERNFRDKDFEINILVSYLPNTT